MRALLIRDLRLAMRAGGGFGLGLAFFLLVAVLVPLGVGPEPATLARIAPGILWVGALLACLLSLDRLFQAEADDGGLDELVLAPAPLELLALGKCAAHWLTTGLPLIVVSPLVAVLLNLPPEAYGTLLATLALGTPSLSLTGGIGAALSVGARKGGALLALIVLPLYVPVLIFAVAAVEAAVAGLPVRPHLFLLGAMAAFTVTVAPFAMATSLRQAAE